MNGILFYELRAVGLAMAGTAGLLFWKSILFIVELAANKLTIVCGLNTSFKWQQLAMFVLNKPFLAVV